MMTVGICRRMEVQRCMFGCCKLSLGSNPYAMDGASICPASLLCLPPLPPSYPPALTAMQMMAMRSVTLRPYTSPMVPNSSAPSGRTTKPMA